MDLIAITSCGYFTKDPQAGEVVYYCIDLPDIVSSKDISPEIKTTGNLSPRLSIKNKD